MLLVVLANGHEPKKLTIGVKVKVATKKLNRNRNISKSEHFGIGTFRNRNISKSEHFGIGTNIVNKPFL